VNSTNRATSGYALTTHKLFLEISVADTGVGIPPEDLPRIFDKFYQGRAGVQNRGSGLGLAIVKHIIEDHGGVIRAESAPAGGSTFHILLPLEPAAA